MRDKSKDSNKSFKDGNVLVSKSDKPSKVKAVADTKTSEVVSAVVPVSNSKAPSEGFECVGCGRRYTVKVPNPDDTKFQTHGWPTAADGSKVLCDKKNFPEKLTAYAQHRKDVVSRKKA